MPLKEKFNGKLALEENNSRKALFLPPPHDARTGDPLSETNTIRVSLMIDTELKQLA